MSPEQVQGHTVDGRSDQFSLAVIAYEIFTGERPFQGEQLSNIVYKIVAEEPLPASRINGSLTPAIDQVLTKALAKNPADRYDNCTAFVASLEVACAEAKNWKPIAAGSAAAMPTVAMHGAVGAGHDVPAPKPTRYFTPADEPHQGPPALPPLPKREPAPQPTSNAHGIRSSVVLPLVLGIIVLSGVALAIAWQAGLIPDSAVTAVQEAFHDAFSNPSTAPTPQRALTTGPAAAAAPVALPEQPKPSPLPNVAAANAAPAANTTPANTTPAGNVAPAAASSALQNLWVSTNPPGAKVVLDDNLNTACQAPCMLHSSSGVHHVTVSQAGYMNEYREIQVGKTAMDIPVITLRQPGGTLMVSSDPPGATVRINGQPQDQVTPASITLKPGTYTVTVEKGGRSQSQRVEMQDSPVLLRVPLGP
jgi:serine/threonine-protein kinase